MVNEDLNALKLEIENLKSQVTITKEGSMERMLIDMHLDMKKDSLRLLERISSISCNTQAIDRKVELMKADNLETKCRVDNMEEAQTLTLTKVSTVETAIAQVHEQISLLTGIVTKQAQQFSHLQDYNEELETKAMCNNIVISLLDELEEETPESLVQMITDFFSQTMQIRKKVAILQAVRTGSGNPCPVRVTLARVRDKGLIFKNVKYLKDARNLEDDKYFVNDHLPIGKQEAIRKK